MNQIKLAIDIIGMKKICLFAHYILAISTSVLFFIVSIVATFLPTMFNVSALCDTWKLILMYCVIIVAYITVYCIFESLASATKKVDWIALFIGASMLITLCIIIVCIVFMFMKSLTEIELQMWQTLIKVFGGIFCTQAGGGYIYNIFKKKFSYGVVAHESDNMISVESMDQKNEN